LQVGGRSITPRDAEKGTSREKIKVEPKEENTFISKANLMPDHQKKMQHLSGRHHFQLADRFRLGKILNRRKILGRKARNPLLNWLHKDGLIFGRQRIAWDWDKKAIGAFLG